ncbi:siderophore ABC transporter substrate-binding protein [Peribacillus glennii]|uniref:Siderophore ABC transporter substrate-binding protein n=1 Tax=Peribacillus glennii TaxID=2303991 RepID=A0A372LDK8_9BACI|nr:siderophore ABC transporter substrate-binding protein [Peribacillus glennii]RFU63833.1 siderophore ABC transporter substrate-binding protein [Peribacillus glennii]
MKKKLSLFLIIAVLTIVAAACGPKESAENGGGSEGTKESETMTIKHQLGEAKVKKNPEKVVTFDFGTLETLDKLGVNVTGVPTENLPAFLDKYKDAENVGGLMEPDFEKINELQPDLIIISGRQQDSYDKFNEIAPTVFMGIDYNNYMDSFKENVTTLGEIFGKEAQAKEELAKIDDSIASLKEKTEGNDDKALITLTSGGKVTAFGPASRFGLIHDVFGIKPATDNLETDPIHGQNISFEFIAEQNPDILYVIDRDAAVGEGNNAKQVIENDLVKKTNAYKNDNIVYLDPGYWYLSGGGLISLAEMVKEAEEGIK